MMTTRNKSFSFLKRSLLFLFFISSSFVFATPEETKWIIASERFSYAKGQNENSVSNGIAEMLPSRILEKMGQNLLRTVEPNERLDRYSFDSRKERISLFLQLSSEYQKRDSLVLTNTTERELKKKIKEENEKIEVIKQKIDENLENLKKEQENTEKLLSKQDRERDKQKIEKGELYKYSSLLKNLFVKDNPVFTNENINFYQNDISSFYKPSEKAIKNGYLSYNMEKECVAAGINTLLSGTITAYGDYLSVAVNLYRYPNAQCIGSIVEVGSMQEFDLLSTSIANQLVPVITNAMPVQVQIFITPEEISKSTFVYIDEQLQESSSQLFFDSGVHTIQFAADGYKSVATSYFFEGNQNYKIEVALEENVYGKMQIGIQRNLLDTMYSSLPLHREYPDYGEIYYNGIEADFTEDSKPQISINGNKILGQFISEDGFTSFYYIPKKLVYDGSMVTISPKPYDRSKDIDVRRKWMYGSYAVFITSLVPTFYYYGAFYNAGTKWNRFINDEIGLPEEEKAETLRLQNNVKLCIGISVACGAFFAFELFRYFKAANAVLPEKANKADTINPMIFPAVTVEETPQPEGILPEVDGEVKSESNNSDENVSETTGVDEKTASVPNPAMTEASAEVTDAVENVVDITDIE